MNFAVTFSLIASCEFSSACFASEWLLPGVSANVSCEMVATREISHTDSALEWLLSCVNTNVTRQFITTRKSPVAVFSWTRVRSFMRRCLSWSWSIFPWFSWFQLSWSLLERLIKNVNWCTYMEHHVIAKCLSPWWKSRALCAATMW